MSAQKKSGHVVWYACKYAPIELLAGFGAQARYADLEPNAFEDAERLAHGNLCGYGKALIALAARGDVRELVLTTCCDVMRRVYDVLAASDMLDFVYLLDVPHRAREEEVARLSDGLRRLARAYENFSGVPFSATRALVACDAVAAAPHANLGERHVTVAGAHAPASLLLLAERATRLPVQNASCSGPRTLALPPRELERAAVATHVGDEGCTACLADADGAAAQAGGAAGAGSVTARAAHRGLRAFTDWYAMTLLAQTPCMRMDGASFRRVASSGGDEAGVVYHTMKFCDYYGLEYVDALRTAQTPVLKVETDGTPQSAGQLRTRLEAFGETIGVEAVGAASRAREGADDAKTGDAGGAGAGAAGAGAGVYVLGVDSGSTSTDAAIVDGAGTVVATAIVPTGARATASARRAIQEVLDKAGLTRDDVAYAVATGYGRDAIPGMDASITEITCHAAGARALVPGTRTIIDIGGQDSKVIRLDDHGDVANFVMNDKCAAGTGRFLETMARTLEMPMEELARAGLTWRHPVHISSMCTVFAESEVVSLVAQDTAVADIVHGLDVSVASKVTSLARRVQAEPPYLMTGGVSNNAGVVNALADALGAPVATHPSSQLCGAIGAAILGLRAIS